MITFVDNRKINLLSLKIRIYKMKLRSIYILAALVSCLTIHGQTQKDVQDLYNEGRYAEALPLLRNEYLLKPTDGILNLRLGVSLYEIGDFKSALEYLQFASNKKVTDSYIYLGQLYTKMYLFEEAEKEFNKYEKAKRRDKDALAKLEESRNYTNRLQRLVGRTEDIQIIDSIILPKSEFLKAYHLSSTAGTLLSVNEFFKDQPKSDFSLFLNERNNKVFYSRTDAKMGSNLYTMEKLLDNFGNEKRLSESVNLLGNQAYPFVMPDGLTLYFASDSHESIGGYDLFVTRYNLATDSYLSPNQLNMPFNSPFNDYMIAIDEEKNVGWFASDRFQPKDSVCIYTFIPNSKVNLVESDDEQIMANRAKITSISDTRKTGVDYTSYINLAKEESGTKLTNKQKDFLFIINDEIIYYSLNDFKSPIARELYIKYTRQKEQLSLLIEEINNKRNQYAQTGDNSKAEISASILNLEQRQIALSKEIDLLEIQSRNEEVKII